LLAARRYRATASGLKMARITNVHTTAPQTLLPAGAPSQRWRIASTTIVNGLTFANAFRGSGIELTGTNAEEMNVSGKTAMKATEFADSGVEVSRPTHAKNHENAKPKKATARRQRSHAVRSH
jgi:hypothetical protein